MARPHRTDYHSLPDPDNPQQDNVYLLSDSPPESEISRNIPPGKLEHTFTADSGRLAPLSRRHFLLFVLTTTGLWVAGGIGIMLAGTSSVHAFLLPRIYTCPSNATCPNNIDPRSNILPLLQSLMHYCLRLGTIVCSFGLVKLIAYKSWFVLKSEGNTIEILDHNIGAIKGNAYDAFVLLLKRHNRTLGVVALFQIAITAIISLILGFSISGQRATRRVDIDFQYAESFFLPKANFRFYNTNGQRAIVNKLDHWMLNGDKLHGRKEGFQGTLVRRDNRAVFATSPQPIGSRISGNLTCSAENITIAEIPGYEWTSSGQYYITYHMSNSSFMAFESVRLTLFFPETSEATTSDDLTVEVSYIWASNTTGLIPNATTSRDKKMNAALCSHIIFMEDIPPSITPGQSIKPSKPIKVVDEDTPYCERSDSDQICMMYSVSDLIENWWRTKGGSDDSFRRISCSNGLLSPMDDDDSPCQVNSTVWTSTLRATLDALMETALPSVNASQRLQVEVDAISVRRWWLQAVIPLLTLLLYVVCMGYIVHLNQSGELLKELTLLEVVTATHTEQMQNVARQRLKGSMKVQVAA